MPSATPRRRDDGFSLVELLVVVLVIGVLVAVAIPTYLGSRGRAADRTVQSDLRTGIVNAKAIAAGGDGGFVLDDSGAVTPARFAAALNAAEGSITWYTTHEPTMESDAVTVAVDGGGQAVLLYKRSRSGRYFGIGSRATGDVFYCQGDVLGDVDVLPGALDDAGNPVAGCADRSW